MEPDEPELVRRCKRGDRDAFDRLLFLHERRVYNLCLRLLGNAEEALDAAQDVFVEAWRGIARFREESALSTWLHSIAVFVCRQSIRRKRRVRARGEFSLDDASIDPDGRRLSEVLPDNAPLPDRSFEAGEAGALVQRALGTLPHVFREATVLRELDGMSYQEVAAALRVRVGTVKSRLSRAKLALRNALRRMPSGRENRP